MQCSRLFEDHAVNVKPISITRVVPFAKEARCTAIKERANG